MVAGNWQLPVTIAALKKSFEQNSYNLYEIGFKINKSMNF